MPAKKLIRAIATSDMAIFSQAQDLTYEWIHNPGTSWLANASKGQRDSDFLAPAVARRAEAVKLEVLRSRRPARFELSIANGSSLRWFDVRIDSDEDGLLGTSVEITAQKQREDTLKALLRELSHRSKNLLAIIQSLASQTARNSETVPEFLVRFRGRIQSLAHSQDIVTDADWHGADLLSLVRSQVERYAPDGMEQIELDVPAVTLTPAASLHVGLALHELAVNAASYGSLSVPGGMVRIEGTMQSHEDGSRELVLQWQERKGPRVRQTRDPRFGTSTLSRIVPNAVGGTAEIQYCPDGLLYRLVIPESQLTLKA